VTHLLRNVAVYQRLSAVASPVSLASIKAYLKITATADDAIIQAMIDAATEWGEKYTGRDFRAITWDLLLDRFTDRIELRRDPVASVTTVKHLVSGSLVTVPSTVFYLKKLVQSSEILLNEDQEWPTDSDDREQVIEIRFVTEGFQCQDSIIQAIERTVAFWYRNRGDCPDVKAAINGAGVTIIYDQFRISRV
jgi:uncharacterized phiE125 gp8 family phage protein